MPERRRTMLASLVRTAPAAHQLLQSSETLMTEYVGRIHVDEETRVIAPEE